MGPISGAAVFFMVWWTILFVVLPWGMTRRDGAAGEQVPGADPGAPQYNNIRRKFLITTLISIGVWLCIFLIIRSDIFSFQRLAAGLKLQ